MIESKYIIKNEDVFKIKPKSGTYLGGFDLDGFADEVLSYIKNPDLYVKVFRDEVYDNKKYYNELLEFLKNFKKDIKNSIKNNLDKGYSYYIYVNNSSSYKDLKIGLFYGNHLSILDLVTYYIEEYKADYIDVYEYFIEAGFKGFKGDKDSSSTKKMRFYRINKYEESLDGLDGLKLLIDAIEPYVGDLNFYLDFKGDVDKFIKHLKVMHDDGDIEVQD